MCCYCACIYCISRFIFKFSSLHESQSFEAILLIIISRANTQPVDTTCAYGSQFNVHSSYAYVTIAIVSIYLHTYTQLAKIIIVNSIESLYQHRRERQHRIKMNMYDLFGCGTYYCCCFHFYFIDAGGSTSWWRVKIAFSESQPVSD